MKVFGVLLTVTTLVLCSAAASSRVGGVHAASYASAGGVKQCHMVTRTVHGKKMRVKVCTKVKPPTLTPTAVPSLFDTPADVTVDSHGNVYVSDTPRSHVVKLAPDGHVLLTIGTPREAPGQFINLSAVAVDSNDNLYTSETRNLSGSGGSPRIQKFSPAGEPSAHFTGPVQGPGALAIPGDIALDSDGNIYVADLIGTGRQSFVEKLSPQGDSLAVSPFAKYPRVKAVTVGPQNRVYSVEADFPDGSGNAASAIVVRALALGPVQTFDFGARGSGAAQMDSPNGIAVDASGTMYVVDAHNDRIQVINGAGVPVAQWGSKGSTPGQFDLAASRVFDGIALDKGGNLYIPDAGNHRVVKLSPDGKVLAVWK